MDPVNCEVVDLSKYSIKGSETVFTIITKDTKGSRCCTGGSHVSVELRRVHGTTQVRDNNDGSYMASFVPQQVGEVKLSVFVDGQQIKGSPYNVMVIDYTLVNKPTKIVNIGGSMDKPWGIAFGKNGMWAVTDWSNHCVYIFDGEDQLVRKFGSQGSGYSQFCRPVGIAFDSDDHLYVADSHSVKKFTINGVFLFLFGGGKLKHPLGLAVHNHKVYVADNGNKHISVFQSDGKFLHTIGSGQLSHPHDVTVNGDNQLLIADCAYHCIHTFTLDGDYVGKFGTPGTGRGELQYPDGIHISN